MEALAAYASASDEDDEAVAAPSSNPNKRQRTSEFSAAPELPPPPLDDDNPIGASRRRWQCPSLEHVDGQYATHVYLPVHLEPRLADALKRSCEALRKSDAAVNAISPTEYHLSLSRTVTLSRAQIDGFNDALRRALRGCPALRASVADALVALPNDTATRHFAALELKAGTAAHGSLCRMIDAVDGVLERYGLPAFYAERRLHFSVAWSLERLPCPLPSIAASGSSGGGAALEVPFDTVECRVGERVTSYRLKPQS